MKKKSIYFVAPAIGLLIFAAIYWNFSSRYETNKERMELTRKHEREEKSRIEALQKKQAYDDAVAAQAKRKKEREEKDRKDQEERDARLQAGEDSQKAKYEAVKLEGTVKSLTKQIDEVKKEIADLEATKKKTTEEEAFQRTYAKQAETNRQSFTDILLKIQAFDKAAEEAARAAALAAKKK